MPTYAFTFPASLAGQRVTVYDALGNGVDNRVLTASGGQAIASFDLPSGSYEAKVDGADGDNAKAVLDDASIEAGGGGGAPTADTAFLLVTGATCDTDASEHALEVEWDERFPEVDWLDITDGVATIPNGALNCTVGEIAEGSIATAISASGFAGGTIKVYSDAAEVVSLDFTEADGPDTSPVTLAPTDPVGAASTVDFDPGATVSVKANMYADDDGSTPITDAVATLTVAVAITRGGSAPTLP